MCSPFNWNTYNFTRNLIADKINWYFSIISICKYGKFPLEILLKMGFIQTNFEQKHATIIDVPIGKFAVLVLIDRRIFAHGSSNLLC